MINQNLMQRFAELQRLDNDLWLLLSNGNIHSGTFNYNKTKVKVDVYCNKLNSFMVDFNAPSIITSLHYHNRAFLKKRLEYSKIESNKNPRTSDKKDSNHSNTSNNKQSIMAALEHCYKNSSMGQYTFEELIRTSLQSTQKNGVGNVIDGLLFCYKNSSMGQYTFEELIRKALNSNNINFETAKVIKGLCSSYKNSSMGQYAFEELIRKALN